jgi:hypothetical protein
VMENSDTYVWLGSEKSLIVSGFTCLARLYCLMATAWLK